MFFLIQLEKHLKISKIEKFGCKMLWNTQNIALRISISFTLNAVRFSERNTINIQILCKLSQGYIFRILQYFTTKLCHFTNFKMIFLAVLIDFVLLAMPNPFTLLIFPSILHNQCFIIAKRNQSEHGSVSKSRLFLALDLFGLMCEIKLNHCYRILKWKVGP